MWNLLVSGRAHARHKGRRGRVSSAKDSRDAVSPAVRFLLAFRGSFSRKTFHSPRNRSRPAGQGGFAVIGRRGLFAGKGPMPEVQAGYFFGMAFSTSRMFFSGLLLISSIRNSSLFHYPTAYTCDRSIATSPLHLATSGQLTRPPPAWP